MQAYVILRGAIFAEAGYNLEFDKTAPNGLRKESNAYFAMTVDGKTTGLEPLCGADGSFDREVHYIWLKEYPSNPELARALVLHMGEHLKGAVENREEDQAHIGAAWRRLAVDCLLPREDQHDLRVVLPVLKNVFGEQRLAFAFNTYQPTARPGRVIALEDPCFDGLREVSSAALAKEALARNRAMSLPAPAPGAL